MRKTLTVFISSLVLLFQACSNQPTSFNPKKRTIISGKIINFNNTKDLNTITLSGRDLFHIFKFNKAESKIDANGIFNIELPIAYTQEFMLTYGGRIMFFCRPGDSLYLEIDRKLSYIKSPVTSYIQFMNNELGKANMEYNKYLREQPKSRYSFKKNKDAVKNLEPDEYKDYIQQYEHYKLKFLEDFNTKYKTSRLFRKWAMDKILYSSMDDLFQYCWLHPEYNKMKRDSFDVSDEYLTFLADYNINDCEVISWEHASFLNEYCKYSLGNPKDSAQTLYDKKPLERYATINNMIKMNSNGLTQKIMYAKFYSLILDTKDIKGFESVYDSTLISDPYLFNEIKTFYNETKDYLEIEKPKETKRNNEYLRNKENLGEIKFRKIESTTTSEIMDSITKEYKGKVVLIDFWAPWCKPCMKELPFTQAIQDHFKDKDVVFLFIANNCPPDDWKKAIVDKKLTGEQILLTKDQFLLLRSELGFAGIPYYTILDKEGNIAIKNASRPSNKVKLISEIESVLNQ